MGVALNPCKGYPSLTYLEQARQRFERASELGKECIILYFGDYDSYGVDIPRSIDDSLYEMSAVSNDIEVKVISLTKEQALKWKLPPAPAKKTDSRTAKFMANGGLGQIELDAVEPKKLAKLAEDAIANEFNYEVYENLKEVEAQERLVYKSRLKEKVYSLFE